MHDGVDVVVDLCELPHSADIHAFMERCVKSQHWGLVSKLFEPNFRQSPNKPG
jgi:hypothetical protein